MADTPSELDLRIKRYLDLRTPYDQAVRYAALDAAPVDPPAAGSPALPRPLAVSATSPENQSALEAAASGGDPRSEGERFAALTPQELQRLSVGELDKGIKAMRQAGLY